MIDTAAQPQAYEHLHLRAELALSLAPLVAGVVAEPDDRGALVADAVACWLALPTAVRDHYQRLHRGSLTALEQFGWDYLALTEQTVTDHLPTPDQVPADADEEQVILDAWAAHVQTIRPQLATGTRPAADWLAQFPVPGGTA
jgi:hypothetical protein